VLGWSLLAALVAAPFAAEYRRAPMDDKARTTCPGSLADLPGGQTHYQWWGPKAGPVAVCIHGLSTPSYIFAGTARSLAALGYRVLTYDLYGRGYSDRPPGHQSIDFFTAQLRSLLERQDIDGPLTLVGFSMGGAIATAFAAEEGKRIEALVLMAPAGVAPLYNGWQSRLWTAPLIGDWAARVLGGWALRRELASDVRAATIVPNLADRQVAETRVRGYLPALLSSRRHTLATTLDDDHRTIARYGIPVLAIWGKDDRVIPVATLGRLAELNPDAFHVQIKGAGHGLPQTHPSKVADALVAFLH
jgi:pimeloyl-ACP methyl ester carboxylesterase